MCLEIFSNIITAKSAIFLVKNNTNKEIGGLNTQVWSFCQEQWKHSPIMTDFPFYLAKLFLKLSIPNCLCQLYDTANGSNPFE